MFLGLGIIVMGFVIGGIALNKMRDDLYLLSTIVGAIIGIILIFVSFNTPSDVKYSVMVGNERRFNNYSYANGNIVIPTHYVNDISWINSWKYCDSQITIIVPKNQTVQIKELGVPEVPYVVGECK